MLDEKTIKRIRFIVLILYVVAVLAVIYFAVAKALGLVMPFVIAFAVAMLLQKPSRFVERKTHGVIKKKWAGSIFIILIILLIAAVISFAGVAIVSYVKDFISYLKSLINQQNLNELKQNLLMYVGNLNGGLQGLAQKAVNGVYDFLSDADKVTSLASGAVGGAWNVAKSVPGVLIATLISIICCFFATASWDDVSRFFMAQLGPRHRELARSTKVAFKDSIGHLFVAYCKIICVTFFEIMLGFYIMKWCGVYSGGFIPLIALIIAVVDILPVLGTGTIMVPWMIYNLIMGNYWFAGGQFALYIIVCVVRQYIEPKFVGKSIGLNPLVTLIAMYIGLKVFGAVGMFLLPISIIVLKALQDTGKIHLWQSIETQQDERDSRPSLFERLRQRVKARGSSEDSPEK